MSHFDFSGKMIIVTGASRGIGKAIAQMLLDLEGKVIVTSTYKKPEWCNQYPQCEHRIVDFCDPESLDMFFEEIDRMSDIDVLINNAGIHMLETISELNDEHWNKILEVNLTAPMKLMRRTIPKMQEKRDGRIVNISSIAGIVSKPTSAAYSSSKAGLIGLTRSSALALASDNIRVNALCPGYTETEMMENLLDEEQKQALIESVPLQRLAQADEIARFAVFLASSWNTYITGQTIVVDGGEIIK